MSGRFAGSQSLDDRRRRRLAAGEPVSGSIAGDESRPLPARAPSDRFPLRRVVSRAHWKAALALLVIAGLGAGVLAIGYLPEVAGGEYGPGLAGLAGDHAANLISVFMAGLLLAAAQYAWLIRWARARSWRDVRARYRIWWWTSTALAVSGLFILTGLPAAGAASVVWATGWPPMWGSLAAYELAPGLAAIIILFPGLQRDMRGCRTSRSLLFISALLLLSAGGATIATEEFANLVLRFAGPVSTPLVMASVWLAGVVSLFGAVLFHARHVVFESVEPPEDHKRTPAPEKNQDRKTASKRQPARAAKSTAEAKTAGGPSKADAAEPADRPASPPKPKRSTAAKNPAPPAPPRTTRWAEIGTIEVEGKVIRLDGPEDPMKGLSKRERRKLRKAIKDRQRSGHVEY